MNDKINSLALEYFWEQKFKEIFYSVIIIFLFVIVPILIGYSIGDNISGICYDFGDDNECNKFQQWIEGLFYLLVIFLIAFILILWIENNWDKAIKKAREKLRK